MVALEDVPKGKLVIEYRGEIISTATCLERMQTVYKEFKNHYFLNYANSDVIDGSVKGTFARYCNHSCDPNCHIEKWSVDGEYRIGIFASDDIPAETELTYDYRFDSFGPLQQCMCGAENCRGFIGANKKIIGNHIKLLTIHNCSQKTEKNGRPKRKAIFR